MPLAVGMQYINIILDQLNNREVALLLWIGIPLLLLIILNKDLRRSFVDIIKIFFSTKILFVALLNTTLFSILILGLSYFGIWSNALFKDTVIWFLATFVLLFSAGDLKEGEGFYKEKFVNLLRWEVFIIFFYSLYVFSFVVEMVLVPVLIMLGMMQGLALDKSEYKNVSNVLAGIIGLIVMFLLANAIRETIIDPFSTFSIQNLKLFIFPIGITIFYIPFVYLLRVYMRYESLFTRLDFHHELTWLFRIRIFFLCGLSSNNIQNFQELAYRGIASSDGIKGMISEYKKLN